MIIRAIKYRTATNIKWVALKFSPPKEQNPRILCHQGNKRDLDEFYAAVLLALEGENSLGQITDVHLYISDERKGGWIIEQSQNGKRRVGKPKKALQGQLHTASSQTDTVQDGKNHELLMPCKVYKLVADCGELIFADMDEVDNDELQLIKRLATRKMDLMIQCRKDFNLTDEASDERLMKLARKLKPLYTKWHGLKHQREILKENMRALPAYDAKSLWHLEKEINLLKSIEEIYRSLNQPTKHLQILKKQLEEIAKNIDLLQTRSFGAKEVRIDYSKVDPQRMLVTLSKLKSYEIAALTLSRVDGQVKKEAFLIFNGYIAQIKNMLLEDTKIAKGINSCVCQLQSNIKDTSTYQKDSNNYPKGTSIKEKLITKVRDWYRFIKFHNLKSNTETYEETRKLEKLKKSAFSLQNQLEGFSQRLSALHKIKDTLLQTPYSHYENSIEGLGALKQDWEKLAKAANIPFDCSIADLFNIIKNHAEIMNLFKEQEILQDKYAEKGRQLKKIEELIIEWRRLTKSQRHTPLTRSSIIFGEVKAILEYLPQKSKALQKSREVKAKYDSYYQLQRQLQNHQGKLHLLWQETFSKVNQYPIEIEDKNWIPFFEKLEQVDCYSLLCDHNQKAIHKGTSETFAGMPRSLKVLIVDDIKRNEVLFDKFINYLKKYQEATDVIVLIQDSATFTELKALGFSCSLPVKVRPKKTEKKSLLSPKAQAALQILRTERTN